MNRKILIFGFLSVLLVAMAIAPVIAQPAQKTTFTAKQFPGSSPPQGDDYRHFVTDGFTSHTQNQKGQGTIKMWTTSPTTSPPDITGTTSSIIDSTVNLKTGQGNIKFQMTWVLTIGTFEGNIIGNLEAPPFTQGSANYAITNLHGVLQGDNGQTITFDGAKPIGQPFTWTGTIIIP